MVIIQPNFSLYSNPEVKSSTAEIVLREGNHSHSLVTRKRFRRSVCRYTFNCKNILWYSSLFAVCALYQKYIAWFSTHCTFHFIYLFIPLNVHIYAIQSINIVWCLYISSLQIIIDSKKITILFLSETQKFFEKTHDSIHLLTRKSFYRIYTAAELKKNRTTESLCMHIKCTKDTYSPILTHPHMLIHLNSFVLKFESDLNGKLLKRTVWSEF